MDPSPVRRTVDEGATQLLLATLRGTIEDASELALDLICGERHPGYRFSGYTLKKDPKGARWSLTARWRLK